MATYKKYPGIDANNNLPPEVLTTIADSTQIQSRYSSKEETSIRIYSALQGLADAYDVALAQGYRGTRDEWLLSLVGPEGPEGPYGGTSVTDPQMASMIADSDSETGGLVREMFASNPTSTTATASTVEHWVSPDGNDQTGDGTEANPFKTVNHAISLMPDTIRHAYAIKLKAGDYPETVRIANKVAYGVITLTGATDNRALYKVRNVIIDRVQGQLQLRNLTSTINDTVGERSFEFRGSGPMMFATNLACTPDVNGPLDETRGLLADYGSTVQVASCDFSGKRYGVRSNYQSSVFLSDSNTGEGNHIGVAARWGGRLNAYYGGLPTGDTPISTNSGGVVSLGHGEIIGDIEETGLVDVENYRQVGETRKVWIASRQSIPSFWVPEVDEFPSGSTIRFRFRAPATNVEYKVGLEWLARTGLTAAQSIEMKAAFFFRGNAFTTESLKVLHSLSMSDTSVTVTPRGSYNDFYINVATGRFQGSEWTARITIDSSVGKLPIFAEAEVI